MKILKRCIVFLVLTLVLPIGIFFTYLSIDHQIKVSKLLQTHLYNGDCIVIGDPAKGCSYDAYLESVHSAVGAFDFRGIAFILFLLPLWFVGMSGFLFLLWGSKRRQRWLFSMLPMIVVLLFFTITFRRRSLPPVCYLLGSYLAGVVFFYVYTFLCRRFSSC